MNKVLSLVHASRSPFTSPPAEAAESMFSELLILHEEMIAQLRLKRLSGVGTAEFLRAMIDQHENAAAMIRAHLEQREANRLNPSGSQH